MDLPMPELISVTSDTVDELLPDLPRMVRLALGYGSKLQRGTLDVTLPDGRSVRLGGNGPGPAAAMNVYDFAFASRLLRGGDIGIAEAYLHGEWDTPDLTQFLRQSRSHPADARRQSADALYPDREALVQPKYQTAGAQEHLCALRHRQRLLFGLARSEHDLFLGAVRGAHSRSRGGAEQQIPQAGR